MTDAAIQYVTLATAILVLWTAILAYRTRSEVKSVHILVNSKMTAALERIDQLTAALTASDTPVPDKQPAPGPIPEVP